MPALMRISLGLCLLCLATSTAGLELEHFNSDENDINITFSADGLEAWLERRNGAWGVQGQQSCLLHTRRNPATSNWSPLVPVSFALAGYSDGDPFFDDDSQTLYFTSDRPHSSLPVNDTNIWRVIRSNQHWGAPEPLSTQINREGVEFSPVRRGSRLYFAGWYDGNGDLYVAEEHQDGDWTRNKLGAGLNSLTGEWNLWVSPDEQLMFFEASGRSTNVSRPGDIYASLKDQMGRWQPALPVSELNGAGSDLNARIIGNQLIYASTSKHPKHADLYSLPAQPVIERIAGAYDRALYVANRSSHEVVSVNLAKGSIATRVSIGPGPHLLAVTAEKVAVAAYGIYPRPHSQPVTKMPGWIQEDGGALLVLDGVPSRHQLRCQHPHGSVWDDTGQRLWVSCEDRFGAIEIDFSKTQPGYRLLPTGQSGAHVMAWDEPRQQLLIAHTGAGGVAFVDPVSADNTFVQLASGSEALWVNPDQPELWVTLGPSGQLAVVGLETKSELDRISPGCAFPIDFAQAWDGLLWVACFGSSEVIAINPVTRKVVDRLSLPAGPLNIEAHPLLPVLYASLPRRNAVIEISLIGRGVTRRFETGIEPDGLAIIATK